MMTTPRAVGSSSIADRARIYWAGARYDFWLDLNSVPRRQRKTLRAELNANLRDASADVGSRTAVANLGSLRMLAAETTRDGQLRSRWLAGWIAGLTALAASVIAFLVMSLYYIEGVLDAGAGEPVSSSLFPFFWSNVTVDSSNGGISSSLGPGPMPLIAAVAVWLMVAKPWRSLGGDLDREPRSK